MKTIVLEKDDTIMILNNEDQGSGVLVSFDRNNKIVFKSFEIELGEDAK